MSENAPPPIGHHPDWLPFIAAVELVLRQVGDPGQAMADAISALDSGVPALVVVRGVRRLVTSTDRLRIRPLTDWGDDDDQPRLAKEWRAETTIELITIDEQGREHREPVLLFVWRPKLEEFLGLRPAAAHEAKGPSEPVAQPERQPEPVEPVVQPESVESCAATPEQKSAKRQTRKTVERTLTDAALDHLCNERPDKYSSGFAGARPNIVQSQIRSIWAKICKDAGVDPKDHPLPDWDMVSRAMKDYVPRAKKD